MNDRKRQGAPDDQPLPGPERETGQGTDASEDTEGHSATIYRRRRGPYPLRHGAPLPDADDRTRSERLRPPHRAVA